MNRAMIASIIAAAAAGVVFAQPVQWRVEDGGNGHWYHFDSRQMSWDRARDAAIEVGGHLVTLNSAAENDFLEQQRQTWGNTGTWCWLGARLDCGSETSPNCDRCHWQWCTGEPWTFSDWRPGEPNCHYLDECAASPGTDWADLYSSHELPFIIEWSADCNADGLVDKGQILAGDLPDANNNGIPDWSVSIARQPVDQSVGVDQPVFFVVETVTTPSCTTPVAYRWQRRNPLVADETAADAWLDLQDGGGFLNTGTPSLTILRPTPALATGYRCRISGGCGCEGTVGGAAFTNTVNFGVACPADFNADGGIDFGDIEAFFERWENGC